MTDHVSIPVKDLEKSGIYYDKTLACLGYSRIYAGDAGDMDVIGYARKDKTAVEFWLFKMKSDTDNKGQYFNTPGLHIGFGSADTKGVQEWHKKCLELGATDNGGAGLRYPGHYAAYIIDPNGWHTEACCHTTEE